MRPITLCILLSSLVATPSAQDAPGEIRWEPFTGSTATGGSIEGRLGRITVPERRAKDGSPRGDATIELAFVVYPSTNPNPGPPTFYLAGGPGGSGVRYCTGPATDPRVDLLAYGDVVGIDQRGTGLTRPSLEEAPDFSWELPLDEPLERDAVIAADRASIAKLAAHWKAQGVDLAAYNTVESADDVDAVREAMGADEIRIWGESYGSHLGLAYLRRHAEHVERAVLCKVEGPDQTWKLPSGLQAQLERASELAAADPTIGAEVPDLVGAIRGLLEELARQPVTIPSPGGGSVVVGPYDLQRALTRLLAHHQLVGMLPAFVVPLTRGDWTRLGQAAAQNRRGGDVSAMTLMMDCASGASPARRKQLERELADPRNLLGDAMDGVHFDICTACDPPDLGRTFRGPLKCGVPTLFVSGELDARTPPSNVEEILSGFSSAAHVVATNTGHEARELQSERFVELLATFLGGTAVESTTVELPPVRFRPLE